MQNRVAELKDRNTFSPCRAYARTHAHTHTHARTRAPRMCHEDRPKLERILQEGNAYLARDFPKMSKINSAWVVPAY